MKNHPHPGRIVRQDFLEPLGLTVTEAAKVLGVARQTINNLVNEKAGISAEMAVRLAGGHGPGGGNDISLPPSCPFRPSPAALSH